MTTHCTSSYQFLQTSHKMKLEHEHIKSGAVVQQKLRSGRLMVRGDD
jgi:hypothetical protein